MLRRRVQRLGRTECSSVSGMPSALGGGRGAWLAATASVAVVRVSLAAVVGACCFRGTIVTSSRLVSWLMKTCCTVLACVRHRTIRFPVSVLYASTWSPTCKIPIAMLIWRIQSALRHEPHGKTSSEHVEVLILFQRAKNYLQVLAAYLGFLLLSLLDYWIQGNSLSRNQFLFVLCAHQDMQY